MLATAPLEIAECPAPAPPASSRARFAGPGVGWAILTAALVLIFRKPDLFLNPQFWAEDFYPFFVDANIFGPRVLAAPYNGYLHFIPRLIASLAAPFHPSMQPAIYVAAALGITLAVVAQVFSPRLNLPGRPWLALAIVAVPHTGEVFLNPANLQWITALALVLTLMKRDAIDAAEWGMDAAVLVAVGLTGPFSVLLLPLFLARAWVRGTRASWVVVAILAPPAAVQAWHLCHAPAFLEMGAWRWSHLLGVLAVRLPMTLACGEVLPVKLGYAWTVSLGGALVAAFAFFCLRRGAWRGARVWLLAGLLLLLLAGIKRGRADTWAFYDTFNGDRYFYGPKVITLWLAVLITAELTSRRLRTLAVALLMGAFAANVPAFRIKPQPDLHWAGYSDKIQAGERIEVPINPGWKVVYPGRSPP